MYASDIAVKLLLLIGERQNWKDEKHVRVPRDPRINLHVGRKNKHRVSIQNTGSQISLSRPKITDHIGLEN